MLRVFVACCVSFAAVAAASVAKPTRDARQVPMVVKGDQAVFSKMRQGHTISQNSLSLLAEEHITKRKSHRSEDMRQFVPVAHWVLIGITFIIAVLALYFSCKSTVPEAQPLAVFPILLFLYVMLKAIPQHKMYMLLENVPYHSYPVLSETIPTFEHIIIVGIFPVAFFIALYFASRMTMRKAINVIICYGLAMSSSIVVTEFLKLLVGRPRPDFFARCLGNDKWPTEHIAWASDGYPLCETPPGQVHMRDAYKSFPSGHASEAFAGLTQLSFCLIGNFSVLSGKGNWIELLLSFMPVVMAVWISATRVIDCSHFTSDVVSGGLIGTGISIIVYLNSFDSFNHLTHDELKNEDKFEEEPFVAADETGKTKRSRFMQRGIF